MKEVNVLETDEGDACLQCGIILNGTWGQEYCNGCDERLIWPVEDDSDEE